LIRTDKDLKLLIEKRRTGPFQPKPINFASHYSEPYTTTFGIDLRKYDETNRAEGQGKVPRVLVVLLDEIERRMKQVESTDGERSFRPFEAALTRLELTYLYSTWLYETPLSTQHALRSLLNSPSTVNSLPSSELQVMFQPFDLPILCSVVKLWLLELETPVIGFSVYEELRGLFPGRITTSEGGEKGLDREGFVKVLGKLPAVHLEVSRS
jgi:hypothetical protein